MTDGADDSAADNRITGTGNLPLSLSLAIPQLSGPPIDDASR